MRVRVSLHRLVLHVLKPLAQDLLRQMLLWCLLLHHLLHLLDLAPISRETQGVREFHGVMQVILYAVYRNNKSGSGAGGKMYGDARIYGKQVADGHHDEG
ncbi:hypothetical protein QYE76_013187 [Lolium multiflorum]|uniref:Secreted protein n=1 Tax=Lolium multiflorum TaxID=4521 RepID=A0AAD8TYE4_LOLMU|nr:hypothetical protein QYE76_013187 [Lolium multiflorum]